jgi:hypothetical protein
LYLNALPFMALPQGLNSGVAASHADMLRLLRQQNDYHDQHKQQQHQQPLPVMTSILLHLLSPSPLPSSVTFLACAIISSCHSAAGLPYHVVQRLLQVTLRSIRKILFPLLLVPLPIVIYIYLSN